MAKLELDFPVWVKIQNVGAKEQAFQPYHENFNVAVPAGVSFEFPVQTLGQYVYYTNQAVEGLEVSKIAEADDASATNIVLNVGGEATISLVITNISERIKAFNVYRENFNVELAAGDAIEFETQTVGQTLFYLAQADKDLTVAQAE